MQVLACASSILSKFSKGMLAIVKHQLALRTPTLIKLSTCYTHALLLTYCDLKLQYIYKKAQMPDFYINTLCSFAEMNDISQKLLNMFLIELFLHKQQRMLPPTASQNQTAPTRTISECISFQTQHKLKSNSKTITKKQTKKRTVFLQGNIFRKSVPRLLKIFLLYTRQSWLKPQEPE